MNKTLTALFMAAMLAPATMMAQNRLDVSANTRFDFHYEDPKAGESASGFHGRYLNLMMKGEINDQLSYNYRQRLNKKIDDSDVFSATDWIYLTYRPTKNWAFAGGKQVVAIGGYEYDAAPINIYYSSMFWQNIGCYQFGVSGQYISDSGDHSLLAQVCNSPALGMSSSCYAYNLMWNGKVGAWSTIWSVNMIETAKGHFAQYIALGNRFDIGDFNLELDLMQRSYEHRAFWLDDYSVIAKAEYAFSPAFTAFVKGGYECFHPARMGVDMDDAAAAHKKPFYGFGIEIRPMKNYRNLRIHALWNKNHGNGQIYTDPETNAYTNTLNTQQFIAGVTWNVDLFHLK